METQFLDVSLTGEHKNRNRQQSNDAAAKRLRLDYSKLQCGIVCELSRVFRIESNVFWGQVTGPVPCGTCPTSDS